MKRIGLVAGCSHSAGSEIDGTPDSDYNRDNSFGSLLCKQLGYEPVNISLNGSTNSGIARSILEWFTQHYDSESMDVFVCIGWTESSRLEIPKLCDYRQNNNAAAWFDMSANNFWRINFGWEGNTEEERTTLPPYQRFMADNPLMLELWTATDVLMIQYMLKSYNIPYVMTNTMHMFQPSEYFTSTLVDKIDETCYYNLKTDQEHSFYHKYKNMGYTNPKAVYWHHNEEPHRLYAEELYNFVRNIKNDLIF
jgi:hypothetical protein